MASSMLVRVSLALEASPIEGGRDGGLEGTNFAMLQYSNYMPAAVAYDGADYKSVIVGFPIESIREADQRNALMRAITNFLCK